MASFDDVKRVLLTKSKAWGYKELPDGRLVCVWTAMPRLNLGLPKLQRIPYPGVIIAANGDGIRVIAFIVKLSEVRDLRGLLRTVGPLGVGKVVVVEDEIQLSHYIMFDGMTEAEILSGVESVHDIAVHLANGVFLPEVGSGITKGKVPVHALDVYCPSCGIQGGVFTMKSQVKSGFSTGKASAAILTGGASVLATGLAKKTTVTGGWCQECDSHF